jgi:TetR/AcrR family transcriptional regulator, mexJK operon transcriptional repressor
LAVSNRSRTRPSHDSVRREIIEATKRLYLAKGYAGTSTDEVAALSAVSKQTIYRHFATKDDLIAAVITDTIASSEEHGAEEFDALAESDNLERDLQAFARQHIADVIQPEIMQLRRRIIGEVDRFPEQAMAWYVAGPKRGHQKLKECFERLRERGLLQMHDPELAAEQFNWLVLSIPMNAAMFDAYAPFDTDKFNYYADDAVRVFLAAYGSQRSSPRQ